MKQTISRFVLLFIGAGCLMAARGEPCKRRDAIRADNEAASFLSWTAVYKSYKHYKQCDDAGIAERYGESVARLLSEHWDGTRQLNRLASRDSGFERFVLRHVDVLMTPTQAANIRNNASRHCPADAVSLCKAIISSLNESVK